MMPNRRTRRRARRHHPIPGECLSIYDPVHFGTDEYGLPVSVTLIYRNLLCGGEPGSGKSSLLNTIIAHAALSSDCRLWLFDGKLVELGLWRQVADVFVGNDITEAIARLRALQAEMDVRYRQLGAANRRKIVRSDGLDVIVCVIDELAYFSVTVGTNAEQDEFDRLVRDLVARGRAAGIIVIAATQRPSADIIPTSLRDLFGYRVAFRCTTDSSSDIILSVGWAKEGHSAKSVAPEDLGIGLLLAEGGIPRKFKAAFLTDEQIRVIVAHAWIMRDRKSS
ncbi:cell division protein FtsK/SpoIIIE [Pseudonocardia dioxanivorans CB1190]|uniref:Cell division protein FtsK/SpoIIIE n=1 Tax=Pseudonocardia dioxanivorans (strain ATCC 55486 / DSM 44775 / JCM 13855 / CB1190) TaxID=675635 RepID=F4CTD8_PSEUX|nr:FtsK/SpoIIIE domain-containing protein [Pseudonocardia dioxanivorans]AEA27363.1 cell division protein FtsK/SpoIIIE [Pseudonocardia dioxanivorans CB1190]